MEKINLKKKMFKKIPQRIKFYFNLIFSLKNISVRF